MYWHSAAIRRLQPSVHARMPSPHTVWPSLVCAGTDGSNPAHGTATTSCGQCRGRTASGSICWHDFMQTSTRYRLYL